MSFFHDRNRKKYPFGLTSWGDHKISDMAPLQTPPLHDPVSDSVSQPPSPPHTARSAFIVLAVVLGLFLYAET